MNRGLYGIICALVLMLFFVLGMSRLEEKQYINHFEEEIELIKKEMCWQTGKLLTHKHKYSTGETQIKY